MGVELRHVRADAGILCWDDLMKLKTVKEVRVKICAVADHGLVDNLEFRGLWHIHSGDDSAWLKRNSPKPWIKTGRLRGNQLIQPRIRLADYLGIEVPEEALKSIGIPSSIYTVPEDRLFHRRISGRVAASWT